VPERGQVPDRQGRTEGVVGNHGLHRRVVRADGRRPLDQHHRYAGRREPVHRFGSVWGAHARRDDETVHPRLLDQPRELGPIVVVLVRRAAQHDP